MPNRANWYNNLSRDQRYSVRNITPEILADSIIIDFEGPKDGTPEFVGVYYQGKSSTSNCLNSLGLFPSCKKSLLIIKDELHELILFIPHIYLN